MWDEGLIRQMQACSIATDFSLKLAFYKMVISYNKNLVLTSLFSSYAKLLSLYHINLPCCQNSNKPWENNSQPITGFMVYPQWNTDAPGYLQPIDWITIPSPLCMTYSMGLAT